jgi:uncharacterized RDD family membrane protein YckC
VTIDVEEWHPPDAQKMPVGPQSFPRTGVNSLASLEGRAAARLLDAMLLGIPYFVVVGVVAMVVAGPEPDPEPVVWTGRLWITVFGPLVGIFIVYETIAVTRWGQTLGKLALGLRVARQANGRCPLWWEAALRVGIVGLLIVIPHPLALVAASGLYMVAGFDPMRRGVPDRVAGTVVVRSRGPASPLRFGPGGPLGPGGPTR